MRWREGGKEVGGGLLLCLLLRFLLCCMDVINVYVDRLQLQDLEPGTRYRLTLFSSALRYPTVTFQTLPSNRLATKMVRPCVV